MRPAKASHAESALVPRRSFLQGLSAAAVASALPRAVAQAGSINWKAIPTPVDRDVLTAQLGQLLQANSPELMNFAVEAYATCILGKILPPDPPLRHAWIVPGGGFIGQWLWDTMFVVDLLSLLPGQAEIIRGVFQNYWDFQQRWNAAKPDFMHGMVANFIKPFDAPGHDRGADWQTFPAYSQAPLLAWGMERVYLRNQDSELIRAGLQPLEDFHEWYWRERDLKGIGLVGVGSYSGVTQHARFETYDNEVDLDGLQMIPHPGRPAGPSNGNWYGSIAIPANTSYLLLSELALARMATIVGNHDLAARRRARYDKGAAAMRKYMWDDSAACFLAIDFETRKKVVSPTVGSFMALMARVPTQQQAAAMAAQLQTPAWATPLPIPTVARSNPRFVSASYWRGDVWPAPNYQVITGLAAYGFHSLAAHVADLTLANALRVGISEHYDSISGRKLGVPGLGMSSTMLTMALDGLTSPAYSIRVRQPAINA